MTCKECGQVVKLTRTMNKCHLNTELSSHEETRCQFNGSKADIKLGIDVHQEFYVVVMQEGGSNPKPPQRFAKGAFLYWAAKLKQKSGAEIYAVYEACGFGFSLQRQLSALAIQCYVVCPQKLDEANKRGKDRRARCQGALLEVGPLRPGQSLRPGAGARAHRRRGTKARYPPAARAIGGRAQATGSSGAQSHGQSRL